MQKLEYCGYRNWNTMDAEIKVPFVEIPDLYKVPIFKGGGQAANFDR